MPLRGEGLSCFVPLSGEGLPRGLYGFRGLVSFLPLIGEDLPLSGEGLSHFVPLSGEGLPLFCTLDALAACSLIT